MIYLIAPMLATSRYLYTSQDIQWLAYAFVVMLLLLLRAIRARSVKIGWGELLLVGYCFWSLFRVNPQIENAPNAMSVGLLGLGLIFLIDWKWKPKRVFWVVFFFEALWNIAALALLNSNHLFYILGPFNQENHFHTINYAAWILLAFLALRLEQKTRPHAFLMLAGLLGFILANSLTASGKMVLVSWGVFGGALAWRKLWPRVRIVMSLKQTMIWGLLITTLLCVGTACILLLLPPIHGFRESFSARQTINMASLSLLKDHWLGGVGTGQYAMHVISYWPSFNVAPFENQVYPGGAHNYLVHIWAELGIVGLLLSLLFLSIPMGWAFRSFIRNEKGPRGLLFPFLLGWYLLISSDYTSQGFISAILATLLVPLLILDHFRTRKLFALQASLARLLMIILALAIGANAYQQIQQARADHIMHKVGLTQKVFPSDMPDFARSLAIRPNSVAYFYGSWLFLREGDVQTASKMVDEMIKISGYHWPVQQRQAEILIQEGRCKEAKTVAQEILRLRKPGSSPVFEKQLDLCQEGVLNHIYTGD